MNDSLYIAVDLGAGSGRVCLVGLGPNELLVEEVRRFRYPPTQSGGHLRWDLSQIFNEVKAGIRTAGNRARELGRPIRSIGVDSWGVDYGLMSADGELDRAADLLPRRTDAGSDGPGLRTRAARRNL